MVNGDDPRLRRVALFDAIVNNTDRKAGHLLPVPGGHLFAVDHGVTFSEEPKLRTVLWAWEGIRSMARKLAGLARVGAGLGNAPGAGPARRRRSRSCCAAGEIAATRARVAGCSLTGRLPVAEARLARHSLAAVLRRHRGLALRHHCVRGGAGGCRRFGGPRAGDRRRDAERPGDPLRPRGKSRRDGPRADRAVRLAAARLGRAGSRGLVGRDRRGMPPALDCGARTTRERRGPPPGRRGPPLGAAAGPDGVAGVALTTQRVDARRRRRRRHSLAAGDRLARPAPNRGPQAGRRAMGHGVPRPRWRPRHGRPLPGRCRGELDRAPRARCLEADPALRRAVVVAHRAADRRVGRLRRRARSATCRSTSSAAAGRAGWDWKWQVAPFERSWLPRLVPPTGRLGELTRGRRGAPRRRAGLPLIAAAGDKQCEALGAGAVQPDVAALSFGTTATIGTTHRRYLEAIPLVPPYPAAIPGAWLVELQVMRGFWMVEWFKREFGATEVARAAALDIPPEALFEELLDGIAAGLDGPRPAAVLDARRPLPGPGGQGRAPRIRRHPRPGARVSRDPRGAGLRPPRGRGADGQAEQGADPGAAHLGRRVAVTGRRAALRGRLRAARLAAAHARGGGPRRGDRRDARPRRSTPIRSTPWRRWSASRIASSPTQPPIAPTRTSTDRSTCRCTTG